MRARLIELTLPVPSLSLCALTAQSRTLSKIFQNCLSVRWSHRWLVTCERIHGSPMFIYNSVLILEVLRFSQRFCFRFKFFWVFDQGCTNFPKIRSHRKILCSRRATRSKFRTGDGRISDNVKNLVAPTCYFMSVGYATDVSKAPRSFETPLTVSKWTPCSLSSNSWANWH